MEEKEKSQKLTGLKIVMCTSGSRGEVQPFIALGKALQKLGNEVVIAVEERVRSLVEESGLKFFPIAGDPTKPLTTKEGQKWLAEGKIMTIMKKVEEETAPYYVQTLTDYLNACEGANIIISSPLAMTKTISIAEKKNIPWIPVLWGPSLPTREFPVWAITDTILPGFLNMFTYTVLFKLLWWQEKSKINNWRQQALQLGPMESLMTTVTKKKIDVLCAFDKYVIPGGNRPKDWLDYYHLIGFFSVEDTPEDQVDPKLVQFLKEGSPPIYLGLGSMPAPDPQFLFNLTVSIVQKLKRRAILVAGWTDLNIKEDISKDILVINMTPHDWLLPKCCAIVHHAGIGTCAAVLRSGIPSVPIPVYLDQPHNGLMLYQLGVAAQPIPFQQLNDVKLCQALEMVFNSQTIQNKAKEMSNVKMDGVQAAIQVMENILERHQNKQ